MTRKTVSDKTFRAAVLALAAVLVLAFLAMPVFADGDEPAQTEESSEILTVGAVSEAPAAGISEKSVKAIVAAAIVGLVASVGAVGMTIAVSKSTDGMARQPEAADKISSSTMLGLVFLETTIIYALIVAVLVIFVL